MSKTTTPKLCRQRERSTPDRAFVLLGGRKVHLGRWGSKQAKTAYHRLLAEWEAGGRTLQHASPETITVNELVACHWRYAEKHYTDSPSELEGIRTACRLLCKLYGTTPACEFGPLALKAVRTQWVADGDWSRKTINTQVGRIKRVFKWAVENELVSASVHHGLTALAGLQYGRTEAREPGKVMPVPDAHIDKIKQHVSLPVLAMIELQLLTGMRPGEVTIMRACDLDTTSKVWTYTPGKHKTQRHGIDRKVVLGPKAQAFIKPFLRADLTAYLFDPKAGHRESRTTARSGPGRRADQKANTPKTARKIRDHYDVTSYRRAITRACETADVPAWSPNQLRHNAATRIRKEYGIDIAQTILGHRLGSAITEVYAEANMDRVVDIIGKVG